MTRPVVRVRRTRSSFFIGIGGNHTRILTGRYNHKSFELAAKWLVKGKAGTHSRATLTAAERHVHKILPTNHDLITRKGDISSTVACPVPRTCNFQFLPNTMAPVPLVEISIRFFPLESFRVCGLYSFLKDGALQSTFCNRFSLPPS